LFQKEKSKRRNAQKIKAEKRELPKKQQNKVKGPKGPEQEKKEKSKAFDGNYDEYQQGQKHPKR
jgi:hypothetical protein